MPKSRSSLSSLMPSSPNLAGNISCNTVNRKTSVCAGLDRKFAPQWNRFHVAFGDSRSVWESRRCAINCWFPHSPRWCALTVQGVKHRALVEFSEPRPALAWHALVHLLFNPQLQYACHHEMCLVVACSSHSASGMDGVLAKKVSCPKMESAGDNRFNLQEIPSSVICR